MATNLDELTSLYKQIAVIEMVEKLKSCGVIWNQISPCQYQYTVFQGSDCWDLYLTKMPNTRVITIDFSKNASYFYSINSNDDPLVQNLYDDLQDADHFEEDQSLLADVQQFKDCGPVTYSEQMVDGIWLNGIALWLPIYIPPVFGVGGSLGGAAESIGNIYNVYPSGGMLIGSLVTTGGTYNVTTSGGAWVNGVAIVLKQVNVSGGIMGAGSAINQMFFPVITHETGGVKPSGTATVGQQHGGLYGAGSAVAKATYPVITHETGGVEINGSVTVTSIYNLITNETGGVEIAGMFKVEYAGGVNVGGSAVAYQQYIGGGAKLAGSATVTSIYNLITHETGGVEIKGSAAVTQEYIGGGVSANGSAKTTSIYNLITHQTGGVKANGSAKIS